MYTQLTFCKRLFCNTTQQKTGANNESAKLPAKLPPKEYPSPTRTQSLLRSRWLQIESSRLNSPDAKRTDMNTIYCTRSNAYPPYMASFIRLLITKFPYLCLSYVRPTLTINFFLFMLIVHTSYFDDQLMMPLTHSTPKTDYSLVCTLYSRYGNHLNSRVNQFSL